MGEAAEPRDWKELLNGEAGRLWVRQVVDPADLASTRSTPENEMD